MLRFSVYDQDGPAKDWPLHHACLVDQDDRVIPGTIRFRDGCIECSAGSQRAIGLRLLYDTGETGNLAIQTCLLPHRDHPYHLSVELARHRIATFLVKSEEWQMLDLSMEHPAMRQWEDARQTLTKALVARDPAVAEEHARHALTQGIEASERLALAHAEILLHRRYLKRPASSGTLGIRLDPSKKGKALEELIQTQFDLLVMPLPWSKLAPKQGQYHWDECDRWMGWAQDNGVKVVVGPLLDMNAGGLPQWVYDGGSLDYERLSDLAYEHVSMVLQRYGDVVGMYNIASGINTNELCSLDRKQMIDLTRTLAVLIRQGRRGRRVMVELSQPWGDFMARNDQAMAPLVYLEQLIQEGVRLDAVGVQLLMGDGQGGMVSRDLMEVSRQLDRFFLLELPIILSNVGAPSEQIGAAGGWWHSKWSPSRQASWAARIFPLALSKPYIESFFWADFFDHEDTMPPRSGLLSVDGRSKPVLQKLLGVRKRFRQPLGPLKLPPKSGGSKA